ncbi:MAG: DUF3429 domain-containing protein [Burkholderiaceae bacterium]|jgi:hypothetical protein|uniref:DUF3429 domain-containing protein n=1 Tax=Polynucleobacter sp. MWH-Loch1C5 TaxID=2689108 RepID=UPI001C0CF3E2|nr:DUF3429 domain-containing protein [Polynucleobacter sp. MWH-Loch1C5]MBU3543132.1 DUF3429 domain-containing protein [Polynucleobacter sp. MWH-Loch1C5]NBV00291.1 DUF3429 domain-containing protein [Burkholderiaceae bacterium]
MLAPITKFLGYAGLIPFIALSALVQFGEPPIDFWAANSLFIYGATIASFVGAIHWGLVLGPQSNQLSHNFWRDRGAWLWGIVPALLAWACLHMPFSLGYFGVAATLLLALAVDRSQYRHLISDAAYLQDFLKMRTILTVIASASLIWAGLSLRQF